MPALEEMLTLPGIRWHARGEQYVAEVGYHRISQVQPDGMVLITRVRTTHYLGDRWHVAEVNTKFESTKADWKGQVAIQRQQYDAEQARRRAAGAPLLPRFKPVWTFIRSKQPSAAPITPKIQSAQAAKENASIKADALMTEILNLTIREARDRYVSRLRKRIGLRLGKGLNSNTFTKQSQNLDLALGLNAGYSRPTRPIDTNKRLGELTFADYEAFVHFWCNKDNVKSGRTAENYLTCFKQMIERLKVPTPDDFDELFKIKLTEPTKIVRYQPDLLRVFLQHDNERVKLFSLMCLNFGYYQVDISRLKLEHITDFDGNPYTSGEMFITKRRERTLHQNEFTTTVYVWPETQQLMEKHRAKPNPFGSYFLSKAGAPYALKTISEVIETVIRANGLNGKISVKQFRKVGASQIKALADSDAMHMFKANAASNADKPYIIDDFARLTDALKKFREKLIADDVLI